MSSRVELRIPPSALVLILGAMAALGPFTMDLYLPAFPAVAHELGVSEAAVQTTLTATAIGLGIGGLLVGPLSDRVGRRRPLIIATTLHVLASVGIAVAPSIELIAVLRAVQGAGAAAGGVLASAMVRDLFGGVQLVRFLARIALVSGLAPIVAPVVGSQLLLAIDWRGVFGVLAAYGAVIVIAVALYVPETIRRRDAARSSLLNDLTQLVKDRVFVGAVAVGGLSFTVIIGFLAISPFLFQSHFGLDPQAFGLYFAVQAVGLLITTQLAARLMRRVPPAVLLAWALPAFLLAGGGLITVAVLDLGVVWAMASCATLVATVGFCNPCLQVLVLHGHPDKAGSAAAIAGFANSTIGSLLSSIPALLGRADALGLGLLVAIAAAAAIGLTWLLLRPRQADRLVEDDLTGPIVIP